MSLTKEAILDKLGAGAEEQIYFEYTNLYAVPGKYHENPFTPSSQKTFKFYVNMRGKIGFKDFSPDRSQYNGDCFTAAMFATGKDFPDTLKDIDARFKLGLNEKSDYVIKPRNVQPYKPLDPKEHAEISYAKQDMKYYDTQYWQKGNVYSQILPYYKIHSCSIAVLNGMLWTTSCRHMPVFVYESDGQGCKIYSPLNPKKKWINSMNKNVIDSLHTLPEHVDKLVIVSGRKDGMVFATHGYYQVSFLSETIIPDSLDILLSRCDEVYCWYDNDAPGVEATKKLCERYPKIKPIFWSAAEKDMFDYSMIQGFGQTRKLLHSHIGKPSFTWDSDYSQVSQVSCSEAS